MAVVVPNVGFQHILRFVEGRRTSPMRVVLRVRASEYKKLDLLRTKTTRVIANSVENGAWSLCVEIKCALIFNFLKVD